MKIEINHYTKIIHKITILDDINLTFESGKAYGLKGKNGSGKTMLMRAVCGLIQPTHGYVSNDGEILGKDISFPRSIGALIENPAFIANYTGYKNLELLDTPGILWPKFDDQEIGLRLAYIGSINDEILTKSELALKFIDFLKINYCNALTDRYNIDIDIQNSENFEILKQIAVARLCLLKGNEPDLDKAAAILFDDFRSGRLGRMTLEEIPE